MGIIHHPAGERPTLIFHMGREDVLARGRAWVDNGASQPAVFRRLATYVDKILKGANPANLPVEQPTVLEFIFNLRARKNWGS